MAIVSYYCADKPPFSLAFSGTLEAALSQGHLSQDLYDYLSVSPSGSLGRDNELIDPITEIAIFQGVT